MSAKTYYFFKVDSGNRFLQLAINKNSEGGDPYFYIGFQDAVAPKLKDGYFRDCDERLYLNGLRDLYYISKSSDISNRDSSRYVTFDGEFLRIWKPDGEIRKASEEEQKEIQQYISSNKRWSKKEKKELDEYVSEESDDIFKEIFRRVYGNKYPSCKDYYIRRIKLASGDRVLNVKLVAEFSRQCLPACIDSLSVQSWLNRGTCRYLASIHGGHINPGDLDDKLRDFLTPETIDLTLFEKHTPTLETLYACYVRKYLDYLDYLEHSNTNASFQDYYGLPDQAITNLSIFTMNPMQMETAATMLLLDLGFGIEFSKGAAFPGVDVRGKFLENNEHDVDEVIFFMKNSLGVTISEKILSKIRSSKVVDIQCKAYDGKGFDEKFCLFLTPRNSNGNPDILSIDKISNYINHGRERFKLTNFENFIKVSTSKLGEAKGL